MLSQETGGRKPVALRSALFIFLAAFLIPASAEARGESIRVSDGVYCVGRGNWGRLKALSDPQDSNVYLISGGMNWLWSTPEPGLGLSRYSPTFEPVDSTRINSKKYSSPAHTSTIREESFRCSSSFRTLRFMPENRRWPRSETPMPATSVIHFFLRCQPLNPSASATHRATGR